MTSGISGLTPIGGICLRGFPGLLYFLRFAGVALAVGSLNPCLCYFAPVGLKILFAYAANSEIVAANAATV